MDSRWLAADFSQLFHVAEAGSWPRIRDHGLLSTSALLDRFGVQGMEREVLEMRHRPAGVPVTHKEKPGGGDQSSPPGKNVRPQPHHAALPRIYSLAPASGLRFARRGRGGPAIWAPLLRVIERKRHLISFIRSVSR
jgi:hypothetical protein